MNGAVDHAGRPRLAWLLVGCMACVAPMAYAASAAAETPGLARAVEAAWTRASEARQAEGESVRAAAARRVAGSLAADGPSLSFSRNEGEWYGGANAGTATETEVGVSWPLWMPGQRRAAIGAARADIGWAEANLQLARLEIAGQVREAAWNAATRQAELALVEARVEFLKKLAHDVGRKVEAGELARSDALAAQADLLAAEAELADARRELHVSHAQWRVLTGLDTFPDGSEIENEAHADVESLIASAGTTPALAAAEFAVERASEQVSVVRRSLGGTPALGIGAKEEAAGPGAASERSLVLSLTVPLGLGARKATARAQAQTALDVAQSELSLARSRHREAIETARLAIALADQQLDSERRRSSLLNERTRLMQQAFSAGEIDLADLLLATRYSTEADADLARRHAEHGLAHARLLQVIGILP
jgi:outer membrane protein TolC